jgi:hypothetical protein
MKLDTYSKAVLTIIALCLIWICVRDVNLIPSATANTPAEYREILGFRLAWNQQRNMGQVGIKPRGDAEFIINVGSINELAGWAALFNQRPVYQNTEGWVYTGSEPVGTR